MNTLVDKYAVKYGVSASLSKRIISCESGFKPEAENKNYKGGEYWSSDFGYWQLNDYYWEEKMSEMGWDIKNPIDNLEAGFWLRSRYGVAPWQASRHCWS